MTMRYFRDCCLYLALIAVVWVFADKVFDLLMDYVGRHFCWLDSNIGHDVFFWILLLSVAIWIFIQPRNASLGIYKNFRRNAIALFFCLFYVIARTSHSDSFVNFTNPSFLAYADVFIIWMTIWYFRPLFNRKRYEEPTDGNQEKKIAKLTGDDTHPEDMLGRKEEAETMCNYIVDQSNDYRTALAISVTGSWGSGKTVFMSYLKDSLKNKGISYFDYSPWLRSQNDVALDFMSHLKHHLYDQNISLSSLEDYIQSLKVSNITGWFNLIIHTITSVLAGSKKSTYQLMEEASDSMMTLKKPVVAFIDDVDRIGREDFLDVMRLIRATANFPNLVYIVAYDRDRTLKLLGAEYGEGFLTKIFNAGHPLTNISDDKLHELAFERFKEYGIKEETDSPFALIALTDYLPTIRELKRYFNQLNKDYQCQKAMIEKTYFDFDFYAKLELLKHTDLLTYMMLKNEPTAYLEVEKDNWNDVLCYRTKEDIELPNEATYQLLMQIFDQEIGEFQMFICPGGLQMLFENDLGDEYISKQQFEKAISENKLIEKVKEWIKQKKQGIQFCLSKNLHLPTDIIVQVLELLVENRPSDIVHHLEVQDYDLFDNCSIDGFSRIGSVKNPYNYVEENHGLYLHLHSSLNAGQKLEEYEIENLRSYISLTERPRELLAIISGMMKQNWKNGVAPDRWQIELAELLFDILVSKEPVDDIKNQYYVVEAMHYLPFFDATGNLLLPQLKKNPAVWLRLTLNVDSDFGPFEKMTVNTNVLHSLFDTYDIYKAVMEDLKHKFEGDQEKQDIITEHLLLTQRTSLIVALSTSQFNSDNYPLLKKILYKEERRGIFVSTYYENTKEMMQKGGCPFFNNEGEKPDLFGEK